MLALPSMAGEGKAITGLRCNIPAARHHSTVRLCHTQERSSCLEGACSATGGWEKGAAHPQHRREEDNVLKTPQKVPREFLERVSFHLVGKDTEGAVRGSGMVQMVRRLEGHGYTLK